MKPEIKGLILFDIDQTLTKNLIEHSNAFTQGFKEIYHIDCTIDIINPSGMTDKQIILETLKKRGLSEHAILLKIDECMTAMITYFTKIKTLKVELLKGVRDLIEDLTKQGFLIGLVTGNIEAIGRYKLDAVKLDHYFKLGGFGNESAKRAELVKLAIKKAKEEFEFEENNNIFVLGDTPKDIIAGREAKTHTIGIATGLYTKEELEQATPTHVLDDLQKTQEIIEMITKTINTKQNIKLVETN